MLDDFADEVADIVGMSQQGGGGAAGGKGSRLADLLSRQKVSQKFGADAPRVVARGGDEDLPQRQPLHERRLKHDSVVARRWEGGGGRGGTERALGGCGDEGEGQFLLLGGVPREGGLGS
jgi:U3 small nucleolar RNA-associated protein 3